MTDAADGIEIVLNGKPHRLAAGASVRDLLEGLALGVPAVAVEVNLELVPKARHAATTLAAGDRVEVVSLVGGG